MKKMIRKQDNAEKPCIKPKVFIGQVDKTSTIAWFDELGQPKRYGPTSQLPSGEWLYALSPFRNNPPLRDERLTAHLAEIALMKRFHDA